MDEYSPDRTEVDDSMPAELEPQLSSLSSPCDLLASIESEGSYTFQGSEDGETEDEESRILRPISVQIPECVLVSPRSCYDGFEPPYSAMPEPEALEMLLSIRSGKNEYLELQLDDFAVYCVTDSYPEEMRSLNQLDTEPKSPDFYFDGVLSNGTQSAYVRRIPIHAMPLGNYGQTSKDQTKDHIWLQSRLNAQKNVYYKIGKPAVEYKRFFEPFLWVADLAKHVVDFLTEMHISGQRVTIHHFRQDFASWLLAAYSASDNIKDVQMWMSKYPRLDYRTAVNASIAFLRKESIGVMGDENADYHPLWNEVLHFQKYIPYNSRAANYHTVVTKYIHNCFSHLPFGERLYALDFGADTKRLRSNLISRLTPPALTIAPCRSLPSRVNEIRPGDTISTARDTTESGTVWGKEKARDDQHDDVWFALVQSVSVDDDGHRVFEVVWYYRPVDTLCGLMKYPWSNELFLSDHCSCREDAKIREDEVSGVHQVEFGGTPDTLKEFFCRQTYLTDDRAWVSLTQSHLKCCHIQITSSPDCTEYCIGDTVLVHLVKNSNVCQPCEIIGTEQQYGKTRVNFRKLPRRHTTDSTASDAPPNELLYTEETVKASPSRIVGKCYIRWFSVTEPIPTPYNRDGVGAFFFLTHQKQWTDDGFAIRPLEEAPPSLKQGYDPRQESVPKLRGLDLFCGGGNFGRGLEEGGSVVMKWANDMDSKALHTYMANTPKPEEVSPFLGSIDDFQRLAIQGRFTKNIPRVGEVDFISGGSPCPGFSNLTNDKKTDAQRKNQSLVAAFASCVDLYRPKYGILENVVGIIQKHRNRDQDVFSQLMCALVGMGYQARLFFLDALSCGSAQVRSRVFIVFAAPGWTLPETPLQTHSYPPSVRNLGLGLLPTGESMARRVIAQSTPFPSKNAAQAAAGLPKIYDAKPDICVPFPDHRVVYSTNTHTMRNRVRLIPKSPHGMNFSQAWYGYYGTKPRAAGRGILTESERNMFMVRGLSTEMGTNSYGRQVSNRPMATIVTRPNPTDAKQGRVIHWDEDRCLSVMEAKRGQGFLDEEVLLGPPHAQFKIIGNSVAREVSLALGAVITDAVMRSYGRNSEALAMDKDDGHMVESSPFWEAPCRGSELESPETSVPVSPDRKEDGSCRKRRRLE
ncbi:hypothetical protein LLEC1_01653 [Akanthomyces lecanii]|uniref:DNA (cytosine-5-)-methyltransferase n=1 Tax=Cordyceps confragosa TaxID=2714763 RepID=A0A179IEC3_CORDF|nr:hypothetical protein LLEC1_01653 [Akanthomyces lecanii]